MLNSAFHRLGFLGLISLVVLGAAPCLATQPAAELSAIEAMLARGDDQSALPRVIALLTALPDDASPRQRAHLELLLARALDAGEKDHDGVIAAATRAIEGFGSDPEFADQVLEARRLRGLAWTRQRNADKALAELGEVERLMRERGADQSPAHAQVLSDLSLAQRISADYGGALTSLDAALAILRQQAAPDSRALARTLIRMGQTSRISGDLERADAAYREALALELTSPDPSGRNQATVLYALGNLARARAQPVQAIDWYAKALPAFKRVYGADSLQSAMLYNNYGNAESEIPGHGDAAIARFQQALEIAQR
ncbi:MAG: tetratricopeptide repeat protein, partial [Dokdonella sp.]